MEAKILNLIPLVIRHKFYRTIGKTKALPLSVTVSVTNMCNSRCRTCFIWEFHLNHPELKEKEFKTEEFEETFKSIGKGLLWATLSGGEPYLRRDLPEICEALCQHCKPLFVNIPTNALTPKKTEEQTKKILGRCNDLKLIVNLSLDGVGPKHDEIRGVPGNFERFLDTYQRLRNLKVEFPRLEVGIHSVVSKYNIDDLLDVYEYVKRLDPDSYITEVAEQRTELFTTHKDITPNPDAYASFVKELSTRIRKDFLKSRKATPKYIQALRLLYYQIAAEELRENRQVIPCYAGYTSCQITPYGDVWPCCVLGYSKPMGNLREVDYDFKKIWFSKKADEIRKHIKEKNCACPLANAHYTNMLCSFTSIMKVFRNLI